MKGGNKADIAFCGCIYVEEVFVSGIGFGVGFFFNNVFVG